MANPRRHRRRNPMGLEKVTEKAYGVDPGEMAFGVAGFLGTEKLAEMVASNIPAGLAASTTAPTGFDLKFILEKTLPRAIAGAVIFMGAKMLKVNPKSTNALGMGASIAVASQALGASNLLPGVVGTGSLVVGDHRPQLPAGNQVAASTPNIGQATRQVVIHTP